MWEEKLNRKFPQNSCNTFEDKGVPDGVWNETSNGKDFEFLDVCSCSGDSCNIDNDPVDLTKTTDSNLNTGSPEPPSGETTNPGSPESPSDSKTSAGNSKSPSDNNVSNPGQTKTSPKDNQTKTSPKDNPADQVSTSSQANGGNHVSY